MRRLVLLVLAVLLPLQFAWGAVAGYCQHESGGRSHHFAHHEHVHKAESEKAADGKLVQDHNCGSCHLLEGFQSFTAESASCRSAAHQILSPVDGWRLSGRMQRVDLAKF